SSADQDGLRPDDYDPISLAMSLNALSSGEGANRTPSAADLAAFDIRMTDAFLSLAADLATGRVDPHAIHEGWSLPPRTVDVFDSFVRVTRGSSVAEVLAELRPATADYAALRAQLARYR